MKEKSKHQSAAHDLGRQIAAILDETEGMNQKRLAQAVGISDKTVSEILNGKYCARSNYLVALADALGYNIVFVRR